MKFADAVSDDALLAELGRRLARHRLDVRLPDDLPEILVDPVLIEHVLVNLLDNAAKYAPAGSRVEIAAGTGEGNIRLTVTDEGPGIAAAEREAVFDQLFFATGRRGNSAYQVSLQGADIAELYTSARALEQRMRELPGGGVLQALT